jgi:type IV pilus assembly protein PilW
MQARGQASHCRDPDMLNRCIPRSGNARGFSLIELMVALVVGLIVIGAVLALIVAIMKSNRETLQATRLNQELRATMAVVATDIRRARGVEDPLTTATAATVPYKDIDTATAGCIRYGYFDLVDDDGDGDTTNDNYHALYLSGGKVWRASGSAPTCTAGGKQLGSDQIAITSMTFTPSAAAPSREFEVSLTGHLVDNDAALASISRTITQTVFVRSVGP